MPEPRTGATSATTSATTSAITSAITSAAGSRVELDSCRLFAGLPSDVLESLRLLATEREYPTDATIFCEGDQAGELYILASGSVELDYTLPNHPDVILRITEVGPGDTFAWSALANGHSLTARARALRPSTAWVIPVRPLRQILDGRPEVGYAVMSRLAELVAARLHDTRQQLRWMQTL